MFDSATFAAADAIHQPWTGHDTQTLVVAAIGIAIVVLLIVAAKVHGFLALTIGSLFVGIGSGIGLGKVALSFEKGVGDVLGGVGVLIVLGAMLGKLLADSGGADEIVDKILTGARHGLPWRMALIAFIIGIPMFFEIGLVLLIPVIMLTIRRSRLPAMYLAIPALAGLSVLHGFVPPHPGPLVAIANVHANVGITLAIGLIIAVPAVIIAGPLYAAVAARLVPIGALGAGGDLIARGSGAGSPGRCRGWRGVWGGVGRGRAHAPPELHLDARHGPHPRGADAGPRRSRRVDEQDRVDLPVPAVHRGPDGGVADRRAAGDGDVRDQCWLHATHPDDEGRREPAADRRRHDDRRGRWWLQAGARGRRRSHRDR